MSELDPAKIMAEHSAVATIWPGDTPWCSACRWNTSGGSPWPCLPYRLAEALAEAKAHVQRVGR